MARLFISYSRKDEPFARRLATDLERLGADVWLDVEDIPAGMKWSSAIQKGLDECELMLVLVSPDSMASTNVEDEWQYFLDQRRPVIPVLCRPTDKIHFQLNRIQYVDFHNLEYAAAFSRLQNELHRQGIALQAVPIELSPGAVEETELPADTPMVAEAEDEAPDEAALPNIETQAESIEAIIVPEFQLPAPAENQPDEQVSVSANTDLAAVQTDDETQLIAPAALREDEPPLVEQAPIPSAQPTWKGKKQRRSKNTPTPLVHPALAESNASIAPKDHPERPPSADRRQVEAGEEKQKWQRTRSPLANTSMRFRLAAVVLLLLLVIGAMFIQSRLASSVSKTPTQMAIQPSTVPASLTSVAPSTPTHVAIAPSLTASLLPTQTVLLRTLSGHTGSVYSVAFSPDGKQILTGSKDNTARLWDMATGQTLRTFSGHTGSVYSVAFSPDGKQVLTGSDDNTARLWDMATGQTLRTFSGHTGSVYSVAFSPDGKQVLTGSQDGTALLWNEATGKALQTFKSLAGSVNSVAFSPDGKQILMGNVDKTARLWDVTKSHIVKTFKGTDVVISVAFSPDGKQVLTGSWDGTALLWDAATGQTVQTFNGHIQLPYNFVISVAFSPDGKQVLIGSEDTMTRLLDVATGQTVQFFKGHTGGVTSVAFSPDGKQVLTGGNDYTARLWNVQPGQ